MPQHQRPMPIILSYTCQHGYQQISLIMFHRAQTYSTLGVTRHHILSCLQVGKPTRTSSTNPQLNMISRNGEASSNLFKPNLVLLMRGRGKSFLHHLWQTHSSQQDVCTIQSLHIGQKTSAVCVADPGLWNANMRFPLSQSLL